MAVLFYLGLSKICLRMLAELEVLPSFGKDKQCNVEAMKGKVLLWGFVDSRSKKQWMATRSCVVTFLQVLISWKAIVNA